MAVKNEKKKHFASGCQTEVKRHKGEKYENYLAKGVRKSRERAEAE
jgi:hypothetical protein